MAGDAKARPRQWRQLIRLIRPEARRGEVAVTRRHHFRGLAVGVGGTLVVALLYGAGAFEVAEDLLLDRRQLFFNSLDVDDRIAHVDIDDNAQASIGRWPWHRDRFAQLLDVIYLARPAAVAVDFLFTEPEQIRIEPPDELPGAAPGADRPVQPSAVAAGRLVRPDDVLAQVIAAGGSVYLGVTVKLDTPLTRAERQAAEAPTPDNVARRELARLVRSDFLADDADINRQWLAALAALKLPASDFKLDRFIASVKRNVAVELARAALDRDPGTDDVDSLCRVLGLDAARMNNRDRKDLRVALDYVRAERCVLERAPPTPPTPPDGQPIQRAFELAPPYVSLARAAKGLAVVGDIEKEFGSVRRLPCVLNVEGRLLPHLGMALAAHALRLNLAGIDLSERGYFNVPDEDGQVYRVPVDDRGRILLHWSPSDTNWVRHARHIAAGRLIQVADTLADLETNSGRYMEGVAELIEAAYPPMIVNGAPQFSAEAAGMLAAVRRWHALTCALARSSVGLPEPPREQQAEAAELATLDIALQAIQMRCVDSLRRELTSYADQPPADDLERERHARLTELAAQAYYEPLLSAYAQAARQNRREADQIMADLRPRLRNKLVFMGFTATAQGDIVPTAVHDTLPGVIAHATLLNTFLKNRFIYFPPRTTELLLVILFGLTATLITASRDFVGTVIIVGGMVVGYFCVNTLILFRMFDLKLELVGIVASILGTAIPVTLYRWWTSDRQKREIRSQLGQYTSPALANRIAEDPLAVELLTRVENRVVTCFFSDLKGFTTIAEQSDPERIRAILNLYLDHMSEVLDRRAALINKFMGDGIFAFFNATVLPQPDTHPREACEAALDCLAALERLKQDQAARGGDDLIQQFSMRVGLATGAAGVGDFGSSRKKDYTVIGDVANLAARLESANKIFGTSVMVAGPTRDAVNDHYDFRYLAELQVKGKHQTVPVYELMGRKGEVSEEELKWSERFAAGVELYKARDWDGCIRHFTRMLARRFDDAGCSAYIEACEEKKAFPPDEHWSGALELKEK